MASATEAITLDTVICILSSCGAGLGAAFFGCILSWADHQKRRNGGAHTPQSHMVAILGVIGSTIFGFSSLVGLYFGPVTLVVVIRAGSLLPANAFFSQVFRLRPLTRDDYLGTLVTISGVLCFTIFCGTPKPPPKSETFLLMLTSTSALACNMALLSIFVLSMSVLLATPVGHDHRLKLVVAVTNVGGVSSAFMDLAAKGWSAALEKGIDAAWVMPLFWLSLAGNVLFLISMRASMIYGCKRCDVLMFVPLNTVLNLLYSVLAGMVVMQEWKQVLSWAGLLGASISVLGGVVMLVSGPAHKEPDCKHVPQGDSWHVHSELDEDSTLVRLAAAAEDPNDAASVKPEDMHRSLSDSAAGAGVGLHSQDGTPAMSTPFLDSQADRDQTPLSPMRTSQSEPSGADNWPTCYSPASGSWSIGSSERRRRYAGRGRSSTYAPGSSAEHDGNIHPRSLFATLAQGLRPDMLRLNTAHREAARVRRRWDRVKMHIRASSERQSTAARFGRGIFSSFSKPTEADDRGRDGDVCYGSPGRAEVDAARDSDQDEDEDSDSSGYGTETSTSGESANGTRLC